MTDFVVSTDLIVLGMSTFAGGQTFDGQMIVDLDDSEALLVRKNGDGGDVFIVDTVAPTTRFGTGETTPTEIIVLDTPALVGDGQRDSHAILWTGKGFETATPHDIDWKAFVNVLTNAGLSEWVLENRIDGAAFVEKLHIRSDGSLTLLGKFLVDSGGGFNFPDANFSVAASPTVGANQAMSTSFDVTGMGQGRVTAVSFDNFVLGAMDDTDRLSTFTVGGAIETPPNQPTTDVSQMVINEPEAVIGAAGGLTNESVLLFSSLPITGDNTYGLYIQANPTLATAAIFISADPIGSGTLDSEAIIMRGQSANGGQHQSDWKQFVDVTSTAGASAWTLQNQLDGAGFVTKFTIDDAGALTIPGNLTVSGAGPHSIGGSLGNHRQLRLSGNFVSGGQGTSATNFHMETDLTGFSGDTNFLAGFAYQGAITTQAVAESITNVSGMHLDEPFITDNLTGGGVITNAQTLLITGAPAEGINNFVLRSTGNAPSLFVGAQFVIGRSTVQDFVQFRLGGSFTSGGGSNSVTGAMFASNLTSASGDLSLSHIRAGVTSGGSIVTSGAGDSVLAATLWLDEPNITLTVSDAMALAATLYISGAPTEGTSANYALFIDNGDARFDGSVQMFANSTFPNPANTFTFGSGVPQTHTHVAIIGAFTSSGISNHAERVFIGGSLTGFNADTLSLAGLLVDASITTQGATNVIADVAQLILNEPDITVGTGDTITNASTLSILGAPTEGVSNWALRVASGDVILGGNLTVSGAGPHSIAGVTFGAVQLLIGSTFTSDGASDIAAGIFHTPAIVGAPGDTSALTGTTLTAGITTQTATESIANIAQLQVNEPFITDNLTGDITQASTVLITGAPTEGLANYALRVVSGATFLGGELEHAGSTLGFFGTSPTTQPAAYTRNATIVEDRTLLASASATALNNNNVLAALIADLQSLGVIG
jgi:hypothetical protein